MVESEETGGDGLQLIFKVMRARFKLNFKVKINLGLFNRINASWDLSWKKTAVTHKTFYYHEKKINKDFRYLFVTRFVRVKREYLENPGVRTKLGPTSRNIASTQSAFFKVLKKLIT